MKNRLLLAGIAMMAMLSTTAQTNATVIDFESGNFGGTTHTPVDNGFIPSTSSSYFPTEYGITFEHFDGNGNLFNPRYARVGGASTAFGSPTSMPDACNGGSTRWDNPWNATGMGCFFLTDDDGTVTPQPKPLRVSYDAMHPLSGHCSVASGYLLDVDCGSGSNQEGWRIDCYEVGNATPVDVIYILCPSWSTLNGVTPAMAYNNLGSSGDGTGTYWEVHSANTFIDYVEFHFIGPSTMNVGVAFDRFNLCSSELVEDTCDVTAGFSSQQKGCTFQFTNTSTSGTQTQIIGYHWDFGDGNSSALENPSHSYATPGIYNVTLTVTAYDGTECCTSDLRMEVNADECGDCDDAIIGFTMRQDDCTPCVYDFEATVSNANAPVLGYYWDFGGTSTQSGQTVTQALTGLTNVCLTVIFQDLSGKNDCCTKTYCLDVDCDSPSGKSGRSSSNSSSVQNMDEQVATALVYPNPTDQLLNLKLEEALSESAEIVVFNVQGQRVASFNASDLASGADGNYALDTKELKEGMYILTTVDKGDKTSVKFFVEH